MEQAKPRVCSMCREQVHPQARRCPSCGHWLGVRGRLMYVWLFAMVLASGYVIIAIITDVPSVLPLKAPPSAVIEQLAIVESSVQTTDQGECGYVSTVGTLKNESPEIAAEDIYVEVRYFDAEGRMIDAEGSEQYGLVLLPGAEAAFSVRGRASRDRDAYDSHQVRIISAEHARF